MAYSKEKLKARIHAKIDELIEAADKGGTLSHMEINIKHADGELMTELKNKYKDKV